MKKDHKENVVGPWAEEKLDLLEKYLKAYNTALKNQPFRRVYIDGFSGAPVCKLRSKTAHDSAPSAFLGDEEAAEAQGRFISGSPLRAIGCDPGFHMLRFIDLDETRSATLAELASDDPRIKVKTGDCNPALQELAQGFDAWDLRGVAFLDPYGAHLHWETLVALAETDKIEVIVNFPAAMAINRQITRDGDIPDNWAAQLDACFGTNEWRDIAYVVEEDLFGNEIVSKQGGMPEKLLDLYLGRLKEVFPYVAAPRLIRNTRGVGLYYLLWAGPNAQGYKIANDIFKRYNTVPGRKGQRGRGGRA
nr:three-Cys-motif partner protein TcmP [Ruegeria sp. A3M17]